MADRPGDDAGRSALDRRLREGLRSAVDGLDPAPGEGGLRAAVAVGRHRRRVRAVAAGTSLAVAAAALALGLTSVSGPRTVPVAVGSGRARSATHRSAPTCATVAFGDGPAGCGGVLSEAPALGLLQGAAAPAAYGAAGRTSSNGPSNGAVPRRLVRGERMVVRLPARRGVAWQRPTIPGAAGAGGPARAPMAVVEWRVDRATGTAEAVLEAVAPGTLVVRVVGLAGGPCRQPASCGPVGVAVTWTLAVVVAKGGAR
ncbi:MAG: hypothetical protein ACYCU7_00975 [Acidimicrobiales bacterium]